MLASNNTPFAAIGFEQWKPDGMKMAVVAARASLVLIDDEIRYRDKQELVLADVFEGDPHRTPMLKPGDLVPFRPSADVTVIGAIHADEPSTTLRAGISVGAWQKRLLATGPRHWHHDRGWKLSQVTAVSSVPLDWRLAAGGRIIGDPDGAVDPRNPIGTGVIHPDYTSTKLEIPAPQIFSDTAPIGPGQTAPPPPQGLGPVSPWWEARSIFAGTYDRAWQESHHPLLPRDFDYRFYQVAPSDSRLQGYLYPGTQIKVQGLLPDSLHLEFSLPDLVPFAKFSFTDGREVLARLHLDGLHLDLQMGVQFDLTWRAWAPLCPALYRIDLELGTTESVSEMDLPVSTLDGLEVDLDLRQT
ncbi:DUF2169 domain-containing protein [Paracoccus sp. (in: a-proteobacteria)]|uniref:DUF2169 family type VI secretion system accessory protein n=1 Tax=Paracoccus sp. TaxID=267 RepID=UPI0035AE62FC